MNFKMAASSVKSNLSDRLWRQRTIARIALLSALLPIFAGVPALAQQATSNHGSASTQAFERLAALAGTWKVANAPGSTLSIRFSMSAGGSVIIESWERRGKPHSLTLYHRDGADLIATHYCPQGNQPRLVLKIADPDAPLAFAFRDVTDLQVGESHLHDLTFDLTDPTRVVRSEIYRRDAVTEPSSLILVRAD